MLNPRPHQIADTHLRRYAVVYIRQSSIEQVRSNTGSAAMQRDLPALLENWGWSPDKIDVVDEDLGVSGAAPELRRGFNGLLERIRANLVGLVMVWDASRLARNILDFAKFVMVARKHDVLLAQSGQIVDFRDPNSEFIGMISGLNAARENRSRAQLSRLSRRKKAEAGLAVSPPPLGYIRDHTGGWIKHPDPRVREILQLAFVPLPVSWTPEGDVTVWLPQRSSILAPLCDRVS